MKGLTSAKTNLGLKSDWVKPGRTKRVPLSPFLLSLIESIKNEKGLKQ